MKIIDFVLQNGSGGGVVPSGDISISANGTYDVTAFANAIVSVSSGGGDDPIATIITGGSIPYYFNSEITAIPSNAAASLSFLNYIELPNLETIGGSAFYNNKLTSVSFPRLSSITSSAAFASCTNLMFIDLPALTIIASNAFGGCTLMSWASFQSVTYISRWAFNGCTKLESLYIMASSAAGLYDRSVFNGTPLSDSSYLGHFGSIYVPASLADTYKSMAYWANYSARIVGI